MLVRTQIAEVTRDFMTGGKAFTLYDLSREIQRRRKKAGLPFARHLDMREEEEECVYETPEVMSGDYVMTLIRISDPGKDSLEARLFHPVGFDPTGYVPLDRSKLGPKPTVCCITMVEKSGGG